MTAAKLDAKDIVAMKELATARLREYAKHRKNDVARGAETEELAGLLVEKYGTGMNDALAIVFDILALPRFDLTPVVDECQKEIDQKAVDHRKQRWDSRPAGIQKT